MNNLLQQRLQQWLQQATQRWGKGFSPTWLAETSVWLLGITGLVLAANLTASLIEHELLAPAPPRARNHRPQDEFRKPLTDFSGVLTANLFQAEVGSFSTAPANPVGTSLDALAARLSLKGFFFGFAILLDSQAGEEAPYGVGDKIENYEVMVVNDQTGFVEIGDGVNLARISKLTDEAGQDQSNEETEDDDPNFRRPPRKAKSVSGDVKVEGNQYFIKSAMLDGELNDFGKLINQARVVPELSEGKFTGYRIKAIDEGSLYQKMGLQNDDIIEQINGQAIDSPEKAMNLFRALRNEKEITLKLKREENPLTLNYHIQ